MIHQPWQKFETNNIYKEKKFVQFLGRKIQKTQMSVIQQIFIYTSVQSGNEQDWMQWHYLWVVCRMMNDEL